MCFKRLRRFTNRRLFQKKALLDLVKPFDLIPKYKGENDFAVAPALRGQGSLKTESLIWSGIRDLNPESHAPKACALAN